MKNKIVAGNWKMHKSFAEAEDLLVEIAQGIEDMPLETDIIVCPPVLYLEMASDIAENSNFYVGAQNVSEHPFGAYTGEISAAMLKSAGADFCIIGHSERRMYQSETDDILAKKATILLENEISPIFCIGETSEIRKGGDYLQFIEQQLTAGLFHLKSQQFENVIIAYEPIWAIGTGITATPSQAQEVHAFIRQLIEKQYSTEVAFNCMLLYGGSCNAGNALELFACPDIDGGLIGGASLKAEDFIAIVNAAETCTKND
ncbi:MAG: triose-phosphate isomerase [Bacteroidales bacterium]|jgi:triosephosphate isomerase|nr:triose-phosphate isomerase [Bacteroidales bacterium]